MNFPANTKVRFVIEITATDGGAPVDPTTLTFRVRNPDSTITDLSSLIVKDATGQYHADTAFVNGGVYTYAWTGTGAVVVQQSASFTILPAPF